MFRIKKRIEISAAHQLTLSYDSKCEELHGHNWIINIYLKSEKLNKDGMIMDFTHIKNEIQNKLDHKNLNEVLNFNPTAENIARWICEQLKDCYRVDVQESEGNIATYVKDEVI